MALMIVYLSAVFCFLLCAILAARTWQYRHSYIHRWVLVIEIGYAAWALSVISTLAVPVFEFKVFITHARMIILPFVYPAWMLLCVALFRPDFAGKLRQYTPWILALPTIVAVCNLLTILGVSGFERLVFYDFHLLPEKGGLVGFTRGPLVGAMFVFSFLTICGGIGVLVWAMLKLRGSRQKQAWVLLLAALWPLLLDLGVIFGESEWPLRQLKIVVLWPFIWGVYYAATRADVLEVVALAQDRVFDQLPGPIVILNGRGQYWDGNTAARRVLGLHDSFRGKAATEVPVLRELLSGHGQFHIYGLSYKVHRHDLAGENLESQAQVLLLSDITELEESNKTLRELHEEITRIYKFNKRVQTVLAHDLTGALAGTQLLLGGVSRELKTLSAEELSQVREAHQTSLDLLSNILTWSHSPQNQVRVDLTERIHLAVRQLSPQIWQKNVEVNLDVPAEPVLLQGSPHMLETILRNLLSNAVKFSPSGGKIEVSVRTHEGRVELVIQDQGPGVSGEFISHMNSGRSVPVSEKGGFGVGLEFTRDFITQMGGQLSFDSQASEGARVTVQFGTLAV